MKFKIYETEEELKKAIVTLAITLASKGIDNSSLDIPFGKEKLSINIKLDVKQ